MHQFASEGRLNLSDCSKFERKLEEKFCFTTGLRQRCISYTLSKFWCIFKLFLCRFTKHFVNRTNLKSNFDHFKAAPSSFSIIKRKTFFEPCFLWGFKFFCQLRKIEFEPYSGNARASKLCFFHQNKLSQFQIFLRKERKIVFVALLFEFEKVSNELGKLCNLLY